MDLDKNIARNFNTVEEKKSFPHPQITKYYYLLKEDLHQGIHQTNS